MTDFTSASSSTSTPTSLESRLRRLELLLGVPADSSIQTKDEIETRLVNLERHFQQQQTSTAGTTSTGGTNPFTAWIEIDKMMEDLSAGTALTHQSKSGIAAPMIYRRQDVLAYADKLKQDMDYVSIILNYILVDNNKPTGTVTEDQVANAPVILNTIVSQEQQERMDSLSSKLGNIQRRTSAASEKLDHMVYHYHQLIQALSEKLVAADEVIRRLE